MRTRIIYLIVFLFTVTFGYAQDESIRKQINSIKKSNAYLYGEATAETEEDAKSIAEDILYHEINEWVAKKKKLKGNSNIFVNNKKEFQTFYSLPRGNMFRSFVYVKKSDIVSGEGYVELIPSASSKVEIESSKVEEISDSPVYPEVVNMIASYSDYYNMADKIKELKASGRIGHYARYASLEKPEIYYLAIYNTEGKVVAVLTPGANRTNVITGKPDKVTNYSGCGAIGFTVNE